MDARFSDFHSTSVSTFVSLSRIRSFLQPAVAHNEGRGPANARERKKGRSGTRRTRERNVGIIRIQFAREFHAGLSFSVRHSPRKFPTNRKKENADRCRRRTGEGGQLEKKWSGTEDERRWKESGWENGPYNWCSSWKAAENKGGRERELPGAKLPMKLRFHLQIKIHVVRCADGKNSTRLLVPFRRRAKTSSFHHFTFFYIHPTLIQLSRLFKLTQLTWETNLVISKYSCGHMSYIYSILLILT